MFWSLRVVRSKVLANSTAEETGGMFDGFATLEVAICNETLTLHSSLVGKLLDYALQKLLCGNTLFVSVRGGLYQDSLDDGACPVQGLPDRCLLAHEQMPAAENWRKLVWISELTLTSFYCFSQLGCAGTSPVDLEVYPRKLCQVMSVRM